MSLRTIALCCGHTMKASSSHQSSVLSLAGPSPLGYENLMEVPLRLQETRWSTALVRAIEKLPLLRVLVSYSVSRAYTACGVVFVKNNLTINHISTFTPCAK